MLGPIGPLVSGFLKKRGYTITRPTAIERQFIRSVWEGLFSEDPQLFATVYQTNRMTLTSVPKWLTEETLSESLWRYGVPVEWTGSHSEINGTGLEDVEKEITAADVLAFVARKMGSGVSYLEIGVSAGKNLVQIERQLTGSSLVGLDVEELNPILREQFASCARAEKPLEFYAVETLSGKSAQKRTSVQQLKSERNNTFDYFSADQFRADTWALMRGRKFNLIFSDGVHSAHALRTELQFLLENDLIDPTRCIMFWDDLYRIDMQSAFLENARILCNMFDREDDAISIFQLHSTYGFRRPMGMFSSV
jgi:hypothetical protein